MLIHDRENHPFARDKVMKHMKISASLDKGTPNMAQGSVLHVGSLEAVGRVVAV